MASIIWEFFCYPATDQSDVALEAAKLERCPILDDRCEKTFNDGTISGVCSISPTRSGPVICCPIRLYADGYKILQDVAHKAFDETLDLIPGREALDYSRDNAKSCVAVFGKRWGGELRLPKKAGKGGYFVDWVLAKIGPTGDLIEFVAVEVQTIDTTGNYRNGYHALKRSRKIESTTAGLNWENVSKRILPQIIYKGQVLQREELCKKGLFFVCPKPVFERISARLGGDPALVRYALQPASITFMTYDYDYEASSGSRWQGSVQEGLHRLLYDTKENEESEADTGLVPLVQTEVRSTTVYKVQEAFNNVTLPDENVYKDAILKALGS